MQPTIPKLHSEDTLSQICAFTVDSLRLYVLVDAAQPKTTVTQLAQHFPEESLLGLFQGMPEQSAQEAGPFIIPLNPFEDRHQPRLNWLLTTETQAPCLIWLWSPLTPMALLNHLQQQLIVILPDGSEALLRFYDPRVIQQITHGLFDANQLKTLLQPVTHARWYLPDAGYCSYPDNTQTG
ncbi:MAG: DUF4123 domain-containing protein [Methylococcaceae bacterium]|jgi:hypothetical protein